jgi:hypothetical protein
MVDLSISASLNRLFSESTDKKERIFPVNSGQYGYNIMVETLIISKVVYKMVSSCDWSVMDQNLLSLRYWFPRYKIFSKVLKALSKS